MIGGGRGAFIGAVHRIAANIDGQIELVAGAFSSDAEKSKASGADSADALYVNGESISVAQRMGKREKLPRGVGIADATTQPSAPNSLCASASIHVKEILGGFEKSERVPFGLK